CLSYVYDDLGWTTAISAIDPDNAASRRVAERLGATYESHRPVSFFTADIYRHQSPQEFRKSLNS
ncbi:MAG: GNAT family N-acetyltransferase, partial [Hyphomicrobiales bacterium]